MVGLSAASTPVLEALHPYVSAFTVCWKWTSSKYPDTGHPHLYNMHPAASLSANTGAHKQAFPFQLSLSLTGVKMGWVSPLHLPEVSRARLHGVGFEVNLSSPLC